MKEYSSEELEQGTGVDENRALVAFDGKVYDVTSSRLWKKGVHVKIHKAGGDLTQAMDLAPHSPDILDKFEQVGVLAGKEEAVEEEIAGPHYLIERILDEHPHPISVHFPIALSIVGSFFMALYLVGRAAEALGIGLPAFLLDEAFEKFSLYCIFLATLAAPVSIATGVLSWIYNYNSIWTRIYRNKVFLSVALVGLQLAALTIRLGMVDGPDLSSPFYLAYAALALAMGPTVMGLGYFGGQITFPR